MCVVVAYRNVNALYLAKIAIFPSHRLGQDGPG